jgi:hypothetical protein
LFDCGIEGCELNPRPKESDDRMGIYNACLQTPSGKKTSIINIWYLLRYYELMENVASPLGGKL